MRYTLRQLEVFLAVAKDGSVSRAARDLHMSQSAVSGALLELERQFEIQLFDRRGKRLALSALGTTLRPRAESVWAQAQEFERALQSQPEVGRLRLGATLTIANYVAAPLMAKFMRAHPHAALSLAVANTEDIARQVANFELDVALIEGEIAHPDLEVTPWRDDQLAVFCAPTHPFARKRTLRDEDLLQADWIVREHGSGTRQTFDRAMHGLLPKLRISLALQHTEAIKGAVAAGLGLGCVSLLALQDAFARGSLKLCRVPHRSFHRQFYFLRHRHAQRSAAIERWVQLCQRPDDTN